MKGFVFFLILLFLHPWSLLASEPTINEVYRAALKKSGYENIETASWKKRANLSSLLPNFQLGYVNRLSNDVNVEVDENVYVGSSSTNVGPETGGLRQGADLQRDFVVRAVWDLSELVYSKYELGISREKRDLFKLRSELLKNLGSAYHMRHRMIKSLKLLKQGKLISKKGESIAAMGVEIEGKLDEATSLLDAYTDGWFSQKISAKE